MAKYAILLGAGASVPYGTPTFQDFRDAAEEILAEEELISNMIPIWKGFYDDINLEEFYSLLQNQLTTGVELDVRGVLSSDDRGALQGTDYLNGNMLNFLHIMSEIERVIPSVIMASANPGGSNVYDELALRIKEADERDWITRSQRWYNTDVVSFNWDTLFEVAARRRRLPVRYPGVFQPGRKYLTVEKPHGSINLEHCPQEDCPNNEITLREDISDHYGETVWTRGRCEGCNTLRQPVLLAPAFVKEPSNILLEWHQTNMKSAFSAIRSCRKLFIVGYRFPLTDYRFYLTFRNAVRLNHTLETILVVNRAKDTEREQRFRWHFAELLDGTGHEDDLEFDFSGVEDWVTRPLV